jgi:hypothetical protein
MTILKLILKIFARLMAYFAIYCFLIAVSNFIFFVIDLLFSTIDLYTTLVPNDLAKYNFIEGYDDTSFYFLWVICFQAIVLPIILFSVIVFTIMINKKISHKNER